MKKLNKKKIRWVVREVEKRDMGVYTIAKVQDISSRHARRVHKKYRMVKDPVLLKPGRKPKPVTEQERKLVVKTCKEYLVGATMVGFSMRKAFTSPIIGYIGYCLKKV